MLIYTNPYKSLCSFFFEEAAGAGGSGDAPKLNATEKLNKAIEDAKVQTDKDLTPADKKEEVKTEVKTTDEKEKEVDKKVEGDELNEEQLKYAKNIFKGLANPDPKIQKATIELFVKAAGLELKEAETVKEVKQVEETLVDLVKAGLGEYDFLADKLGPVLEKVITKLVNEKTKDIRDEIQLTKEEKVRSQVSTGIDEAFALYSNSVEVKNEVIKLMDESPYNGKVSYTVYFTRLLQVAASEKGLTLKSSKEDKTKEINKEKQEKNKNDVGSRLSSDRASEAKEGIKSSQRKGLDRAVREAVEETLQKMNG